VRHLERLGAVVVVISGLVVSPVVAQEIHRNQIRWEKRQKDPVLKEMIERDKKLKKEAEEKTEEIVKKIKAERKKERESRPRLRFDLEGMEIPAGPTAFKTVWHNPPVAQYLSGTCWDFSATSFMESEIKRLTGKEIKLSEMWTAYWEYVEKARGYVRARGLSEFGQGSESNALTRIWAEYGVVPESAYKGILAEDGRIDHAEMFNRMRSFLRWCKGHDVWDEELVIPTIRRILDLYMGRPPESFQWKGSSYTPKEFLQAVCSVRPEDYVSVMSTLSVPFYTHGEFKVEDNWWHDKSYVNLPLDVWYSVIVKAIGAGESIVIGGDVSEAGYWGEHDIAVVPSFDIPGPYIDQDARELRIYNRTTGDDHGIHLVGYTRTKDGHDWFLIKDSARSARHGEYDGYLMYRDDYVRLKMLTFTVHKDFIKDVLTKVEATEAELAKKKAEEEAAAEKDKPKETTARH